ncbi:hypothetical protein MATL_G00258370 [Megalops atlanticus]|uniref:Zinc finger piccolo-type domain-containing protein n=1 Tax=Megalops atlanticus TaxID=7932 RepID=A0A9D3P9P8_MEGAT|nr:hypothetical protein MATL_G00258370 [Megalops atlanticus]
MGNEASLEGGEGGLAGLPEGVASDGKGGFIQVPAGMEANLSQLSEEERKQIAAVMSRAQAKPPGTASNAPSQRKPEVDANHQPRQPGKPTAQGLSGISKSRTVDALKPGPAARQAPPGKSPSSVSLLESRARQEAKEQPRTGMFSSNFLSGANPLSAVSSAVNKFSLFGDEPEEGEGAKQKPQQQQQQQQAAKPAGQKPGPDKAPQQGPPKQGQAAPQQKAPPQQGPGKPGPQQQGPQGSPKQGPAKAGPASQGPSKAEPGKAGAAGQKPLCPLCKSTELNQNTKEQPNYNTCTQCKTVVCSLCGFSPPDSAGKEWLCLNCQMQRALGGMDPPGPPMMKPQPKQAPASGSPQRKQAPPAAQPPKAEPARAAETKPASPLAKQQATPPATPPAAQKGPGPAAGQAKPAEAQGPPKTAAAQKPAEQPVPAGGKQPAAGSQSPAPQAQPPKQESGFFGLSFGGSKPQPSASQPAESVSGKLFGFAGFGDTAKPAAAAAAPPAESVSGKVFGFGSSIFSSASNLITSAVQDEPPSTPPSAHKKPSAPDGKAAGAQKPEQAPPAAAPPPAQEKKPAPVKSDKPASEPPKAAGPPKGADPSPPPPKAAQVNCPLCKVELNVGSDGPPNYNTCTECKNTVCNLCGFNPMPHLSEKEWLCLNCQTQRALAGQLGDMGRMPPPMPAPTKPAAQQPAVPKSQPLPAKQPTPQPTTQVTMEKAPPKPAPDQPKKDLAKAGPPPAAATPTAAAPGKGTTATAMPDRMPPQKPTAAAASTAERKQQEKKVEVVATEKEIKQPEGDAKKVVSEPPQPPDKEKGEGKPDTSGSSQQKSPQGLSDTGYSSEGISAAPGRRQRSDSVEDSSESEPSPILQRRRKVSSTSTSSEDYRKESPSSADEEEFIRKQIMEMSADEAVSPSDEDNYIRKQIREQQQQREQEERKAEVTSAPGKSKQLPTKTSEEKEPSRPTLLQEDKTQEHEVPDTKVSEPTSVDGEEGGVAVRRFKTIDLNNSTAAPERQSTEEGEQEMESLTDSPEDRSRGEGSSSLHASSFTPGTSPTSVSSLDEDSDSSPSHKKMSSESKHRKSRHRQHGQVLPTIEDSSEEEELREEEELLREQEMQREVDHQQQAKRGSSKKSKKDKEELRAQRRREYPKTPPSNLSPIEDASPTEELRQAAEMEELHKSSCSDYSPSIESEPEGFEINPEKILSVQKEYHLPTSVPLYSPTDEPQIDATKDSTGKMLKSADEAYEEIMQKAKALQSKKEIESPPEKEPLYGGMLIEDYIYESLVEEHETMDASYVPPQDSSKISIQEPVKKLSAPLGRKMLKRRTVKFRGRSQFPHQTSHKLIKR